MTSARADQAGGRRDLEQRGGSRSRPARNSAARRGGQPCGIGRLRAEVERPRAGRRAGAGSCRDAGRRAAARPGVGSTAGTGPAAAPPGPRSCALAAAGDLGERGAVDPVRDQHPVGDRRRPAGTSEVGVVAERVGERRLRGGLLPVVDLGHHPGAQLGEESARVQAGGGDPHQRDEPLELAQVGGERVARPRVLHLHRDRRGRRARSPRCTWPMLAAAAGSSSNSAKLVSPVPSELVGEHPVDHARRHRRGGFLEPGQRLAVRAGELLGQRGLHRRHPLPDLHRAALELAQHREQLLGGARLHLRRDQLRRAPADASPQTHGAAAHERRRERGKPRPAHQPPRRQVTHTGILTASNRPRRVDAAGNASGPGAGSGRTMVVAGEDRPSCPMLILLDDLDRCIATRPATPGERVAARVRATRLDRYLAAGVSPDSSAALALRPRRWSGPRCAAPWHAVCSGSWPRRPPRRRPGASVPGVWVRPERILRVADELRLLIDHLLTLGRCRPGGWPWSRCC